ncbi:MAG: Zn-ribbon containing protein [Candidatus Woesearchaeota archaeon]
MKHKCTNCGKIYDRTDNIIRGCICGNNRFFFVKTRKSIKKEEIEEEDKIIILDTENIQILEPGKYNIDIEKLLNTKTPIYSYSDGKYSIDLKSILK